MTVAELAKQLSLEALSLPDGGREINGVYTGDLLSWVMGRAQGGNAWATIMTNINVLAVASLLDLACVCLTESVEIDNAFLKTAADKEVNVLRTGLTTYQLCKELSKLDL